jgi:hypothetical protein
MNHHMLRVVGFEVPIVGLVEMNDDGHDLTQHQPRLRARLGLAWTQGVPGTSLGKPLTEIIDITEQFEYTHGDTFLW